MDSINTFVTLKAAFSKKSCRWLVNCRLGEAQA